MGKRWHWFLMAFMVCHCSSPEKPDPTASQVTVTGKKVVTGKPNLYRAPLPVRVPLAVRQELSDGSSLTDGRYRGWDVNRDGRVDVVERLDERGNLQSAAYDFDYDGNVDMVKHKASVKSP